ncbi:MAG: aminopeptidase, partial [Halobacteriota archaeon]
MDPRISEHAEILVDHSTAVEPGDNVIVRGHAEVEPLVVALYDLLGERGANPFTLGSSPRAQRAYLRSSDPAGFDLADHMLAAIEETDVYISIRGGLNLFATADVPPAVNTAYGKAQQPILDERLQTRWVGTQHPTPDAAQAAQMSLEAYADFVYEAVTRDWEAQRAHQQQLVDVLDGASEVRIRSGDRTDLFLRVDDMIPINDHAKHNLPGGEVFTAPRPDATEGTVLFDMPLIAQGREVQDAYLEFEGGEVVDHAATKNEAVLSAVLETDEGARRLGELGIGMNRSIDRFTYNMLFDEKMG